MNLRFTRLYITYNSNVLRYSVSFIRTTVDVIHLFILSISYTKIF